MKIALGAARSLAFLHEEAERPVIYRDFKSSNILLDSDYNVKLATSCYCKTAMPNSLILGLLKMALKEARWAVYIADSLNSAVFHCSQHLESSSSSSSIVGANKNNIPTAPYRTKLLPECTACRAMLFERENDQRNKL